MCSPQRTLVGCFKSTAPFGMVWWVLWCLKKYDEQIQDFINRRVLIELDEAYCKNWKGPVNYCSHHEVLKESSASTPVRIATNSSLKYRGKSLNSIMMKGPNSFTMTFL